MAENEMTAMRGMPQCVRLSEGLGLTARSELREQLFCCSDGGKRAAQSGQIGQLNTLRVDRLSGKLKISRGAAIMRQGTLKAQI